MTNKIDEVVSTLGTHKAYLGPLTKYPSKTKNDDEIKSKSTKGGKFIAEVFGGEKRGNYFAFHKKDIADENGKVFTIEEILQNFSTLLLLCLYSGEGELIGRVGKMRGGIGTDKPSPIVFWRHEENIPMDDIYVLSFATGGTKKQRQNRVEGPCHSYCEENRLDGKRFALAEYSASNGVNGTKAYGVDTHIMNIVSMKYEEGVKEFAILDLKIQKALGMFMSANAQYIISNGGINAEIVPGSLNE